MGRWITRLTLRARALKREGVTLWFVLRHPRTPRLVRLLAVLVVAYALSPIALTPNFIPVLGFLDDVIILPALIWLALRLIPADVRQECHDQAQAWFESHGRKPRWWVGGVLVVGVWAVVAGLLVWGLWHAFAAG